MRRWPVLQGPLAALLVLAVLTPVVAASPSTGVTGLWPVGLGTGAVLVTSASRRWLVAVVVGGLVAVTVLLSGSSSAVLALGFGSTAAAEVWSAARLLQRSDGRRPELRTDQDLRRYFAAALGSAVVAAPCYALTCLLADVGDPGRLAGSIGVAHLASQLVVVPFFLRLPTQGAITGRGERAAQWTVLLVGTPLLLLPESSPSLGFLVIPILTWGALRIRPSESLAQLLLVVALAIVLTSYEAGPFADIPERYDLPSDLSVIALSAFCATCAVMVVPCMVRVGEYVGAARASAAERDLVQGIVDGATGVAIVGTDAEGRITLFNPGAERLLGYRAEEVLGRRSRMLHSPAAVVDKATELGVEPDFAAVVAAMVERRLVSTPIRFRRKDGVERTHAMTLARLTTSGRTSGYVSTSEDITDLLDTEQALRDALEVERQAVERLRDVDAVKDQFVSTVSHELRTPITSILGYLELLADGTLGELDGAQVDALLRVQSNSQRLLTLIDDLLTLSRVAETGIGTQEQQLDLRAAVRTAYDVVAPAWDPPRALDVSLALPDEAVPVRGDRDLLERVVVNLLGNAVKFTDDGGVVEVRLAVDDAARVAVLRVRDSGIGIPVEEQPQLFTRFFRSSLAEQRAIPGSGLGLAIASSVAEQHGGAIAITSRPGAGTTVEVRLPLSRGMSKIQPSLDPATAPR